MKVACKNKLVLEKCPPYSKWVGMGALWVYDVAMVWTCACLALGFRFDLNLSAVPIQYVRELWKYGSLQMAVVFPVFYGGHLYAIMWGTADIREMVLIGLSYLSIALVQPVGMLLLDARMSRSYYALWFVLVAAAFMWGCNSFQVMRRIVNRLNRAMGQEKPPRVMIIGGGEAGTFIVRGVKGSKKIHGLPVCIVDDDRDKQGRMIDGVPTMGTRQNIVKLVKEKEIDRIYAAISTTAPEQIRNILGICQKTGCQVKTLLGVYQLMNGEVSISRFRKIEIEDLLSRESVCTNLDEIMGYVKDKAVLVTGGGGSIGSELYRQLAGHKVRQLIIFDIYENNAYKIQQELGRKYPQMDLVVLIGSVRNTNRLEYLFRTYRPDIVYHAAAHKYVPLMEDNPCEAIKNNVMRIYKAARAAIKYGVKRFILIPTDKAVNPTNIMGTSKRLCEMVVQMSNQKSSTESAAIRSGNVLGSNGNVTPLFKRQTESGRPVTVTHKDITRHFMTISEAVSLVIQAGACVKGGEILVLNMGNPVRILDMAENLIRLSGYEPYRDIDIHFTGLRLGEKLYEELPMDEEGPQRAENERIFIGKPIEMDYDRFERALYCLGEAAKSETGDVRQLVHELVLEYHYKGMDSDPAVAEAAAGRESGVVVLNVDRLAGYKKVAVYQLGLK